MTTLTIEEKAAFAPMLQTTYEAIAPDAIAADPDLDGDVEAIIEVTTDADRPVAYGGMSPEQYNRLCECSTDPDTQAWLREVLNY